MYFKYLFIFFLLSICCCQLMAQQPFKAGNIVVYRVGDGSTALSSSAAPVFLDEYTQSGTLVQSIAMPVEPNGSHHRLTAKGMDDEGLLTLSSNGQYLIVPGGNAAVGTVPGGTAGIIGVVDFNGKINTTTAVTDYNTVSGGFLLRSATSDDGKRFWFGRFNELRYTTLGSTTSSMIGTTGNYMAGFSIADGQLYVSLETPSPRVRKVGTGLPTTDGQSLVGLPGFGSASARNPKHFAFADLDPSVPGVDVLYVADRGNSVEGGIRKFSLVGENWVANGVIGSPADQYHGLTLNVSGNVVTVFATRLGSNSSTVWGGELVKLTDNSGYNGTLTAAPVVLAAVTTPNNTSFRGVALVPKGCASVLQQEVINITSSQATVSWTAPLAGASGYEYAVTQSETPPALGTAVGNTSVTVMGLNNEVNYYAHVRSVCTGLGQSTWSTKSFKTGCNAPSVVAMTVHVNNTGEASLRWNKVFGAISYEYHLSKTAVSPATGTPVTDTFFTAKLDAVSTYYLHVRSSCGNAFSPWSVKSFKTNCLQPVLTLNVSDNLAASWNRVVNADLYEYAITNGYIKPASGVYTRDTVCRIDKTTGHFLHVRSICNTGSVSDWTTREFHVQGMEVYPNPVGDVLSIKIYGAVTGKGQVRIADVTGKLVKQFAYNGATLTVDTHGWSTGVYLIRYSDGATNYTTRVVKQ